MSIDAIKSAAVSRIRDLVLVGELGLQDGRADGIHWKCRNPQRADRTVGSFVVDIGGRAPGRFMEFAAGSDARSGEGGDVIDLVSYCLSGPGSYKTREARAAAIDWLARWTGVGERTGAPLQTVTPADKRAQAKRQAEANAAREADEAAGRAERAKKAKGWWLGSGVPIAGTPVEVYLERTRGIPLGEIRLTGAIRALPPSLRGPRWTMFSAMARDSDIRAVHMTYLTPDGRKANVDPNKKMWGDVRGACVRVSKGDVALTPEAAAKRGRRGALAICEGIEDALTLSMLWPGWQVWAAGSVGNLRAVAEECGWPGCADQVVLVADNDVAGSPAAGAFDKAVNAWLSVSEGRDVRVMRPSEFKDANEAWRAN